MNLFIPFFHESSSHSMQPPRTPSDEHGGRDWGLLTGDDGVGLRKNYSLNTF